MQLRFTVIPDYSETESAVIVSTHHSMIDGQGMGAFYKILADEMDGSDIPSFPEQPWYFWVTMYTILIFAVPLYSFINFFGFSHDRNALHRGVPLTTRKKAAATRDINIPKLKEIAKI